MSNRISRMILPLAAAGFVVTATDYASAEGEWQPIEFGTIFDDWKDPWIGPPDGSGGAPRQGWLNTFDGFFTKEWHLAYAWTKNAAGSADAHVGIFRFNHPLTKRLWVGVEVPMIVHVADQNDFGDITITVKKMLHETQDLSINTGMGIRLATGDPETGGDLWGFSPQLNIWSDLGNGWSLRGGILFNFTPEGNSPAPKSSFLGNVAIGHTITEHSAARRHSEILRITWRPILASVSVVKTMISRSLPSPPASVPTSAMRRSSWRASKFRSAIPIRLPRG